MQEKALFWNKKTIGLSVASEELKAPLLSAMAIWNEVPCAQLKLVWDPHSPNQVILRQKQDWIFEPKILAITILTHFGTPAILEKVQIEVNQNDQIWTPTDYQNILLHELGHVLGLRHSERWDAVMHPNGQLGDIERQLSESDKANFCALEPMILSQQAQPTGGCSQTGFFSTDMGLVGVLLVSLLICCTARKHSSMWRWI